MNAETWTQARAAFERARDLPAPDQDRALEALGDPELAREVRALLDADRDEAPLLDRDALALHAEALRDDERAPRVGDVLAGHCVLEVLGEGGSATVFRARPVGDGSDDAAPDVALKVLKAEAASPGLLERFAQERAALRGLDHPGLIRVLGAGRLDDGRPYLVTEYVAGLPIDAFCERAALGPRERARLFVAVCRAVHHAHRHLVVHRDLKPSNILVRDDGAPVVLDFGIAKLLDPERDPGWTDVYGRGPLTPGFASPEQLRGEPATTATDVYSLGVLLYHLVTGRGPYRADADDRAALERAVREEPPLAPRTAAAETGRRAPPRDLVAILERALRKDPNERYPSVEHLAEDVTRFLEHRPLLAQREPWSRRALRFAKRRPLTAAAWVAALSLVLGGWLGTQRNLDRVRASESVAWRAHANAVRTADLLATMLERIASTEGVPRDALRATLADAEGRLADYADTPEAEARIRIALAAAERALGRAADAEPHVRRALELTRTTRGLTWRDEARCLALLAEVLAGRDDAGARSAARERLAVVEAAVGPGSPEALEARRALPPAAAP